jgi:amino acid permease
MVWKGSIQYLGKKLGQKTSQPSVIGLVSQFVSFTTFGNVLAFSTTNIRLTPHKVGFGLVPFTYSMEESMSEPKEMMKATKMSLSIVAVAYVFLGGLISIIFVKGIRGDILSELPNSSLPTFLRMLMTIVVLTSVPLIIIPSGDLLHDKIIRKPNGADRGKSVYVIRFILAQICAGISVAVPNFVFVISFIGCFCVTLLSFVYPPILHLRCLHEFVPKEKRQSMKMLMVVDVVIFFLGMITTVFTSWLTFNSMLEEMKKPS